MNLTDELGRLACLFRGNRDLIHRQQVAGEYADVVRKLIVSGTWDECPSFEDQLPNIYMPDEFFQYWRIN
jgi:hypothetical protein